MLCGHVISSEEQNWYLVYTPESSDDVEMLFPSRCEGAAQEQGRLLSYVSPIHYNSVVVSTVDNQGMAGWARTEDPATGRTYYFRVTWRFADETDARRAGIDGAARVETRNLHVHTSRRGCKQADAPSSLNLIATRGTLAEPVAARVVCSITRLVKVEIVRPFDQRLSAAPGEETSSGFRIDTHTQTAFEFVDGNTGMDKPVAPL